MGLVIELPEEPVEEIYLWPENVRAWNTFQSAQSQWIVGMGGATGLNYPGVESMLRMCGIPRREWPDLFGLIQEMERATLEVWDEKRSKDAS